MTFAGSHKYVATIIVWTSICPTVIITGMATVAKSRSGIAGKPSGRKPRGFDSLEQQAFLNLWRSYDRLKALEDALFGRYDLTAQQYNALRLLRAEHPAGLQTLTLAGRLISRAPISRGWSTSWWNASWSSGIARPTTAAWCKWRSRPRAWHS